MNPFKTIGKRRAPSSLDRPPELVATSSKMTNRNLVEWAPTLPIIIADLFQPPMVRMGPIVEPLGSGNQAKAK